VLNEAVGLGALETLLADDSISEIMVNGPSDVFVERGGRLQRVPVVFSSDKALYRVIERIVAPIGRRIDESSPLVDARLRDGSRVNIIIPPLAIKGPTITIRKFSKRRLGIEDLIGFGSASAEMFEFLRICVEQKKNIVVSGGTGSGKTTLLNVLSNLIPASERIVTIEDAAELRLHHDNLVTLEARPKNLEGKGQVAIRELVRNALRMRPDRIVVGECRGGEALDMLQAMNTGHDGSLTTAHANSPRDVLSRLEVMVLMAGMDLPVQAIREQIASAVQVIVQQTRFACGTRKVTRITEITGVEHGTIQSQDLFRFERTGFDGNGRIQGYFTGCGQIPSFYEEVQRAGVQLELSLFAERNANGVIEQGRLT
jgi:pilus assembly protein CpaF